MKKLYLVDVSSMFFRAFYAVRPLTSKSGMPTNAIYGFLSMITKLLREIKPEYMAFCFDRPEPSFRKALDERYKANRSEMPEDLIPQVPYIRKLTEIMGICAIDKLNYEADDVIGTLVEFGRKNHLEVVIVSGDKDFAQLIGPHVTMFDTMKDIHFDENEIKAKWGVAPEYFRDYLAITGDTSDNIPGVKGIGPKGAQKLIEDYKTLENIYAHIDEIKGATQKKLLEHKVDALLSQQLVTIKTDLDLGLTLEQLKLSPLNHHELALLLEELSFQSFAKKLLGASTEAGKNEGEGSTMSQIQAEIRGQFDENDTIKNSEKNTEHRYVASVYSLVEKEFSPRKLGQWLLAREEVFSVSNERGLFFFDQTEVVWSGAPLEELKEHLSTLNLESLRWKSFDLKRLWHELDLKNPSGVWDTHLAAYVVDSKPPGTFEQLYAKFTGKALPEFPRVSQVASAHLELAETLLHSLETTSTLKVYQELDIPLIPVLYAMEKRGMELDGEELKSQSQSLATDLKQMEHHIYELAGTSFNILSPKQLGQILFEKLGLPTGKKTKTGYSTDSEVLEKLVSQFPIAQAILNYRELAKLKATYTDSLPQLINPVTHRVHTSLSQTTTTTGRLSSHQPNLQNIPIRTERGRLVRKAFVASKGHLLISADYSQIELRILAHFARDKGLIEAFMNDIDIHAATAAEVFDVPLSQVTPELRRTAKAVNFGIAYGQGVFGLAETLGISRDESKGIIQRYFTKFPGVKTYMTEIVEKAKANGYVETLFGRRRYLDELKSSRPAIQKFGERAAINAPIQGTAADIVKLAMIEVFHKVDKRLTLQVHDELILEVPKDEAEAIIPAVKVAMETCVELLVPLKVNAAFGPNWDEAH